MTECHNCESSRQVEVLHFGGTSFDITTTHETPATNQHHVNLSNNPSSNWQGLNGAASHSHHSNGAQNNMSSMSAVTMQNVPASTRGETVLDAQPSLIELDLVYDYPGQTTTIPPSLNIQYAPNSSSVSPSYDTAVPAASMADQASHHSRKPSLARTNTEDFDPDCWPMSIDAQLQDQPPLPQDHDDVGSKFERILQLIEDAGLQGFDSLVEQYYTGSFKEDTVIYYAQSKSRSRSLGHLLGCLHESTKNWGGREARGYQQHIIKVAEEFFVDEVVHARKDLGQRPPSADSGVGFSRSEMGDGPWEQDRPDWLQRRGSEQDYRDRRAIIREKVCVHSILGLHRLDYLQCTDSSSMFLDARNMVVACRIDSHRRHASLAGCPSCFCFPPDVMSVHGALRKTAGT